ncbi:MAG: hypothetical protein ACOH19_11825 [Rhodoglobus sp.]
MTTLRIAALASAGVFVAAWIVGLSMNGMTVEVIDGVVATTTHASAGITQPVLVHGVAAVALVALGFTLGRLLRSALVPVLACIAALLSLAQLACEVVIADGLANPGMWAVALVLLDGAKMLVLAALMVAVLATSRRVRSVKFVLLPVTVASAAAISLSGIGYLAISEPLMRSAFVSLPLLLLWAIAAAATAQGHVVRRDDIDSAM